MTLKILKKKCFFGVKTSRFSLILRNIIMDVITRYVGREDSNMPLQLCSPVSVLPACTHKYESRQKLIYFAFWKLLHAVLSAGVIFIKKITFCKKLFQEYHQSGK